MKNYLIATIAILFISSAVNAGIANSYLKKYVEPTFLENVGAKTLEQLYSENCTTVGFMGMTEEDYRNLNKWRDQCIETVKEIFEGNY